MSLGKTTLSVAEVNESIEFFICVNENFTQILVMSKKILLGQGCFCEDFVFSRQM